jgi:homoserine dehydrogenase
MPDLPDHRTIGVALLGCGIVGGGVADLLLDDGDLLRRRTGVTFDLRHVVVRDPSKGDRRPGLPVTTDAAAAIADPTVDVVVELIGGTSVAADHLSMALRLGKPVVTANKSLLAARGPELFALARKHGVPIAFEASCGGGIPIIHALMHGLVANRIDALVGIVNGTCNYILTQMTQRGMPYAEALAGAQAVGFAEADPTLDVSGRDAAQKLAVLAGLAFNARVLESDIQVEGIDTLDALDIHLAGELGYVIKLLAIGERTAGGQLALRVHPTLVQTGNVLADVSGGFNAVSVYGHAVGHTLFYGRGAGRRPTASAVVADLVDVALGTAALSARRMNVFPDRLERADILPIAELSGRYYLRLTVRDEPGVLAQITAILGQQRISLSAVLQHEAGSDGQAVQVVITTHRAKEGDVQAAAALINALPAVARPAVVLRIIDPPQEFAANG